jgi:hypothetical protein
MCADDHVDMACHDAPPVNFKPFLLLAVLPAVDHDIFVFAADKQIDPVYNSEAHKIKLVLVVEFIFGAHIRLNVHF